MYKPKYIVKLDQVPQLCAAEREALKKVTEKFVFRSNEYYQSLIDWNDPDDPIRRVVIPQLEMPRY